MTPADPLTVLLDRACRGLTSDEAAALRAAVHQLRQRAAGSERQYELAMEGWNREADAQDQRTARYRAAWQSARRRARLTPEAGQEIHDGTRWRPALQAYSVLRARLTRAEQQLAALHDGEQPVPANGIPRRPGEWITAWNNQSPAARLQHAQRILDVSLEVGALYDQVATVRELHSPYRSVYDEGDNRSCTHCNQLTGTAVPWPCDTARALQ
ncbi:hypothetical protein ACWEO1_22700 [Kitasatospora cineracea]